MQRLNPRLIGLFALLAAVSLYVATKHWAETRQYLLLEAPLSLAAGETTYTLDVQNSGNYNLFLEVWPNEVAPTRVAWSIAGGPAVLESGGAKEIHLSQETFLGAAHLKPGNYTLRFKVLTDRRALDSFNPVLCVNADSDTYEKANSRYEHLMIVSGVMGAIAACLILFSLRRRPLELPVPNGAAIQRPDRAARFVGYGRRLRLVNFGYTAAVFFGLTMIVMMVLTGAFNPTSRGLWVQLLKLGAMPQAPDKWSQPVIVRVTATRRTLPTGVTSFEPHYFVNDVEVRDDQLTAKLRELLVTRTDRTVYVEGDPDAQLMWVVSVVDEAKTAYASRVVLLTESNGSGKRNNAR